MGVDALYQAIPPESLFYQRLQAERPLALLVATVFPCGSGLFRFFEVPDDEIDDVVDFALEQYPDALGIGVEARRRWIERLRVEIEQTRVAFPGIENRAVWLEKSVGEIERRLLRRFASLGIEGAAKLAETLLFGDRTLGAPWIGRGEESVGVLSSGSLRAALSGKMYTLRGEAEQPLGGGLNFRLGRPRA